MSNADLDIEPDDVLSTTPAAGLEQIGKFLPVDFPLMTLLRFLPDVQMKLRVEKLATEVLAIDVSAGNGLARADSLLAGLRAAIKDVEAAFADPADLANKLHKRLTGLRADFIRSGEAAADVVGRRIYAEKRRLDAAVEQERRRLQEEANAIARKEAERVAKEAAARKAPAATVAVLKEHAKAAVAPPVAAPPAPTLSDSSAVERWKARLRDTVDGMEPNPDMNELTAAQQQFARTFFGAVSRGELSLSYTSINWAALNRRANAERTTFDVPGLEAFDDGNIRGKGRR